MAAKVVTTGAINWDVNLFVDRIVSSGEEVPVKRLTRVPGGKAANVAVAVARLLGRGGCAVLGAVGDDDVGKRHLRIFEDEGVDTSALLTLEGVESGQAHIMIDAEGRNQIYTHFGANAALDEKLARSERAAGLLRGAKALVAMDPPLHYTRALFESLPDDILVVWAPGVRTLGSEQEVIGLLKHARYLVLNEQELAGLTSRRSVEEGYRYLSAAAPGLKLMVTLGSQGAVLMGGKRTVRTAGIDINRAGLKVVNTVGCGDAFIGCFAASVVEGMTEQDALRRANFAGAFKATKAETRGSPTAAELDGFMSRFERAE